METELGVDAARNYIIAPHVIEEADLGYLNFFLDRITNERLRKHWAKASANSRADALLSKFSSKKWQTKKCP